MGCTKHSPPDSALGRTHGGGLQAHTNTSEHRARTDIFLFHGVSDDIFSLRPDHEKGEACVHGGALSSHGQPDCMA